MLQLISPQTPSLSGGGQLDGGQLFKGSALRQFCLQTGRPADDSPTITSWVGLPVARTARQLKIVTKPEKEIEKLQTQKNLPRPNQAHSSFRYYSESKGIWPSKLKIAKMSSLLYPKSAPLIQVKEERQHRRKRQFTSIASCLVITKSDFRAVIGNWTTVFRPTDKNLQSRFSWYGIEAMEEASISLSQSLQH
jgi:hypothetical protein